MRNMMSGHFKKIKKRRILVISSGGLKGGLQCLYLATSGETWEIISHAFIPFPQKITALLDSISDAPGSGISPSDITWLDYRLSLLYTDCAKTVLAKLPTAQRRPHLAVLNKPCLWKGPTGEDLQQMQWDMPLGDAQHLSSTFGIPVLTDLVRHRCLAGGDAAQSAHYGNIRLASLIGGTVIFINIGLVARMTIIDSKQGEILVDSDTGPGTCCINQIMQHSAAGTDGEKFDRDGTLAAQGTVNGDCLQKLSEDPWFSKPTPKQASPEQFDNLADDPDLKKLTDADRLATITALTARTIYQFYRTEFKTGPDSPAIILSGGGTNNQTLTGYLSTYFDMIPVESIEKYGIPVDMRMPLALGLTVNAHIGGVAIPWETGSNPEIRPLGKWVLP